MNEVADYEILHRRALALAKRIEPTPQSGRMEPVFLFATHNEVHAIPAAFVQEVIGLRHFTPVPCTPDFVLGITSIHGEIVPIFDVGQLFGLPKAALTNLNKVVVIEGAGQRFGIAIDEPRGLCEIDMDSLRDGPVPANETFAAYILGLADEGVVVLDLGALLDSGHLVIGTTQPSAAKAGGVA